MDEVWPEQKPLETFLEQSAPGVLARITKNYYNKLSSQLSLAMAKMNEMQRNVIRGHDEVHRVLTSYNDSLKLDEDFLL